jgi:hypothetical protein
MVREIGRDISGFAMIYPCDFVFCGVLLLGNTMHSIVFDVKIDVISV